MPVSILADSAASLPADLATARAITIVPMLLTLGDQTVRDGEIALEEVVARSASGFASSAPTPGQYLTAIEAAAARDGGDGAVILTVAQTMSSAYDSARLAVKQLTQPVEVVDTGTASGGEGLVAVAAADAASRGLDVSAVAQVARDVAAQVKLVATLENLDHLARSGRVPGAAAWAGRWLHLHPVFEFVNGHPHPLRPARSRAGAFDRILAQWRASRPGKARLHVAALHALEPGPADDLLARVRAEYDADIATAFVAPFSAVMIAHTGPHLAGLSWWWEPA